MKKRIKSAGDSRASKSAIISRNLDDEEAIQTVVAEFKFNRKEKLTKSTSHHRLRSGSGIGGSSSEILLRSEKSPKGKLSWGKASDPFLSKKKVQRKILFPPNGEDDGSESECHPGERGKGRSNTIDFSSKSFTIAVPFRAGSSSYDSSEKNTEDSEFSAEESEEDFSTGPPLNFAILENVNINNEDGSEAGSDEERKKKYKRNSARKRVSLMETGQRGSWRSSTEEKKNHNELNNINKETEDGGSESGAAEEDAEGKGASLPPLNLTILTSSPAPPSSREKPATFSPRNSPRHRGMTTGMDPSVRGLTRTKSTDWQALSASEEKKEERRRSQEDRKKKRDSYDKEEKDKEKDGDDEEGQEKDDDLDRGLKMSSPMKMGIRQREGMLGMSSPVDMTRMMKRGESMGAIPSWSIRKRGSEGGPSLSSSSASHRNGAIPEESEEGDETGREERPTTARLLFSAEISPRSAKPGNDAGGEGEEPKDIKPFASLSSFPTSFRNSPHSGRRKSGTMSTAKRQSYFAADNPAERPASPAIARKPRKSSTPNLRSGDSLFIKPASRRDTLMKQNTFTAFPSRSEWEALKAADQNQSDSSPSTTPEEEQREKGREKKSPRSSLSFSSPLKPATNAPALNGRSSAAQTVLLGSSSISTRRRAMAVRRLQRSKSLSDVDSLKEAAFLLENHGKTGDKENSRVMSSRKHGRKPSYAESILPLGGSGIRMKNSVSDEAMVRSKRKKMRESKRRLRDEDPFTLLLSKNKLFLKELFSPDLKFVGAICNGVEIEDIELICNSLIHLFHANGLAVNLLKWAIKNEIQSTSEGALQTFLREDNRMLTQFLKHYALLIGKEYLIDVLKPAIRKIISSKDSYEVDPRKLSQKDRLEKNIKKLQKLCQAILDSVFSTKNACPPAIQVIACYLNQEVVVSKKGTGEGYGDSFGLSCVSTFFFLRFFCPALVSPKDHGVVKKTPTDEARNGLLLAAKVVQVLANGQRFTQPHLLPLNSFIEANEEAMRNFLTSLATKSAVSFFDAPSAPNEIPVEEIERDVGPALSNIKDYCNRNRKKFAYCAQQV